MFEPNYVEHSYLANVKHSCFHSLQLTIRYDINKGSENLNSNKSDMTCIPGISMLVFINVLSETDHSSG